MLREIRDLGFEYAELSHGTRISLMPGILEAVDAGEMKISSLHNFCPLPIGVNYSAPNLYQFSSELPRERDMAHRCAGGGLARRERRYEKLYRQTSRNGRPRRKTDPEI